MRKHWLFWRWQPERRGPLRHRGPALAAEVVKNCRGVAVCSYSNRRKQPFSIQAVFSWNIHDPCFTWFC